MINHSFLYCYPTYIPFLFLLFSFYLSFSFFFSLSLFFLYLLLFLCSLSLFFLYSSQCYPYPYSYSSLHRRARKSQQRKMNVSQNSSSQTDVSTAEKTRRTGGKHALTSRFLPSYPKSTPSRTNQITHGKHVTTLNQNRDSTVLKTITSTGSSSGIGSDQLLTVLHPYSTSISPVSPVGMISHSSSSSSSSLSPPPKLDSNSYPKQPEGERQQNRFLFRYFR